MRWPRRRDNVRKQLLQVNVRKPKSASPKSEPSGVFVVCRSVSNADP
jgi:hypothetical protein